MTIDFYTATQHFTLCIEEQKMAVCFTPCRFGNYGHFEFSSQHEPRQRIILSETGYLSHFAPMAEIKEAPDVEDYALVLALTLLRQPTRDDRDEIEPAQLGLF